jgi:hypothetical protein
VYNSYRSNIVKASRASSLVGGTKPRLDPGTYTGLLSLSPTDKEGVATATLLVPTGATHSERWRMKDDEGYFSVEWRRWRAGLFPSVTAQLIFDRLPFESIVRLMQNVPVCVEIESLVIGPRVEGKAGNWVGIVDGEEATRFHPSIGDVEKQLRKSGWTQPTITTTIRDIWATRPLTDKIIKEWDHVLCSPQERKPHSS